MGYDLSYKTREWRLVGNGRQITDAGLRHLRATVNVVELHLFHTSLTDAGMSHIAALPELESLTISDAKITDASIRYIAALKKLTQLDLYETQVTSEGENLLRSALPGCLIDRKAALPPAARFEPDN